jgi:MEDS: MEthanogen/methylotroph, DcmR Sensory domain
VRSTLRLVPRTAEVESFALGAYNLEVRAGDHAAFLYWTPEERLDLAVPYVAEGLAAGDLVAYFAADSPPSAVERALAAAGLDPAARAAEGRLVIASALDAFFHDGAFDLDTAADALRALAVSAAVAGLRRARLFVEMAFLDADAPGLDRAIELEARADTALGGLPSVWVLAFDAARAASDRAADALRVHPMVIAHGTAGMNPYYRPWSELRTIPAPRPS